MGRVPHFIEIQMREIVSVVIAMLVSSCSALKGRVHFAGRIEAEMPSEKTVILVGVIMRIAAFTLVTIETLKLIVGRHSKLRRTVLIAGEQQGEAKEARHRGHLTSLDSNFDAI
jgi:hypothetical protein